MEAAAPLATLLDVCVEPVVRCLGDRVDVQVVEVSMRVYIERGVKHQVRGQIHCTLSSMDHFFNLLDMTFRNLEIT